MRRWMESCSVGVTDVRQPAAERAAVERFDAGLRQFYVPEGECAAIRSFSVAPSGYEVMGVQMPEHEQTATDILRYKANG